MYICIYVYVYMYMYTCIYVYVYMYICIYVYTYIYIRIYVYIYIYVYVYMYICIYVYMYTCIHVYIYMHMVLYVVTSVKYNVYTYIQSYIYILIYIYMFWFVTCLPFVAYITYAILTPRSGPFWKSVLPSYEHPNWSANAKSNGRTWHAKSNRSWGNWAETPNPHESSMNPKFLYSNGHSRGINRISLNLPIKLLCLKILIGCWNYFEGQDGSSFFF